MEGQSQRLTGKLGGELAIQLFLKHTALQCKYEHVVLTLSLLGTTKQFLLFIIELEEKNKKKAWGHIEVV